LKGEKYMKKKMRIMSLFFLLILHHALGSSLYADGFIIPRPKPGENIPPLSIKYHRVETKIIDQVAKTSIDQVFVNNYPYDIEGIFIFPLPEKASISEFTMYVGEKKVEGEILERDEARRLYEEIVRTLKDPALLEYAGRNLFRARVYPIPGKGEKRVTLSYTEILMKERDLVRYVYPLSTESFSLHPIKEIMIATEISSRIPIINIYSSSHQLSVKRKGENQALVSFEAQNLKPDKDFILYYSLSPEEVGLSLLNWEDEERYFMLLIAPKYAERKEKVLNKNIIFVLDSSGSMSGKKMEQAKDAVRFIIKNLDEGDRFSLIDFDFGVEVFSEKIVPATPENQKKALSFLDEVEASGGTNINEALVRALKLTEKGERPNYILFLTDGLPTVGPVSIPEILKNVNEANVTNSRIFVFGVGYDVNTELLDRISGDNKGTSIYVDEDEDLEVAISNYYTKISSPLLADLKLDFEGIETKDVYPQKLPDLFSGSQLIIVGKYKGEGPVTVSLSGKKGKEEKRFVLRKQKLVKNQDYNFLPRLWATRRIGYLLDEIRFHGEEKELVEEVKKLGLKFGIITPYTSFLVTEEERQRIDAAMPQAAQALSEREVTGEGAIKIAKAAQKMKLEEMAPQISSEKIKYKNGKTFYLKDEFWVDSEYEEGQSLAEIKFGSEEYFRLVREEPQIAPYLSLSNKLIVCYKGKNYKIFE